MEETVLTVLIPTVDRVDSFRNALESVMRQIRDMPVKVVVSDNASQQNEKLEYLQSLIHFYPTITVLTRSKRLRPVEHFRQIIEGVESEYLLLLADDDLIGSDYIPEFFTSLAEKEFDTLKPRWVLSIDGLEKWGTQKNFLESGLPSIKLCSFFSSPDDSLFYSIIRTSLLKQHIKSFPEHWSTTIERQPFWAYHIVLYLIVNSKIRNTREASSTWVNFEKNEKIQSEEFELLIPDLGHNRFPNKLIKKNGLLDSLAKLLWFQLYLIQMLVSLKGFRWVFVCSLGSFWFFIRKIGAKFHRVRNS